MANEVQFQEGPGYLIAEVSGPWDELNAMSQIDAIRDEANKRNHSRLLIDMRKVLPPKDQMSRFYTGKHVAKVLPPPFKVAAFAKSELINRFAEKIAVNRGAMIAVFSEEKAAIEWLMDESSTALVEKGKTAQLVLRH